MSTIEKALGKKKLAAEQAQQEQAKQAEELASASSSQAQNQETVAAQTASHTPAPQTQASVSPTEQPVPAVRHFDIDLGALEARGMVMETGMRRKVNEEYRAIKRKLLNNAFGSNASTHENGNLIMVSSARPNEGKTFNAINLAISMAVEKDRTVLLIDADVLKPSVCSELGVKPRQGLIEYLLGEVEDLSEIIYTTNIPALRIIPAGMPHYQSAELLSSDRMASLVKEISTRYDDRVVLFDAPPMLGVNETAILANLMGQAVLVAEQDKSRIADLKEALLHINTDIATGVILNKSTHAAHGGYGYGYGYGYAYNYGQESSDKTSR